MGTGTGEKPPTSVAALCVEVSVGDPIRVSQIVDRLLLREGR
jgi:hypothetical protein